MPTPTQLRNDVAALAESADVDLDALWRQVASPVAAVGALRDALPALVQDYGAAAAMLAVDWYDETRDELGVGGRFAASPVLLDDAGADALAGWAAGPLFRQEPDWDAARVLVSGGLQRRIANHSRLTVARASIADPQAKGWMRVGSPRCDFCKMLVGRGAVYSESTAHFDAHDHCNCAAAPAFAGAPLLTAA